MRWSNALSSPTTPPWTVVTPAAFTAAASSVIRAALSVGSPPPTRHRGPAMTPSTGAVPAIARVAIRPSGPSRMSVAVLTKSFSTDAGTRWSSARRSKMVLPLSRSRTTMPADGPAARISRVSLAWTADSEAAVAGPAVRSAAAMTTATRTRRRTEDTRSRTPHPPDGCGQRLGVLRVPVCAEPLQLRRLRLRLGLQTGDEQRLVDASLEDRHPHLHALRDDLSALEPGLACQLGGGQVVGHWRLPPMGLLCDKRIRL